MQRVTRIQSRQRSDVRHQAVTCSDKSKHCRHLSFTVGLSLFLYYYFFIYFSFGLLLQSRLYNCCKVPSWIFFFWGGARDHIPTPIVSPNKFQERPSRMLKEPFSGRQYRPSGWWRGEWLLHPQELHPALGTLEIGGLSPTNTMGWIRPWQSVDTEVVLQRSCDFVFCIYELYFTIR